MNHNSLDLVLLCNTQPEQLYQLAILGDKYYRSQKSSSFIFLTYSQIERKEPGLNRSHGLLLVVFGFQ